MRLSLDVSAVPPRPAGAGRYILELARHLAQSGVTPTLFARNNDALRWEMLGGAIDVRAVAPVSRPVRLAWEQVKLPSLLRDMDVHHGPHYTMPERAKIPVVVTVHDMTLFDHPEWHERSKVLVFRRAISVAVNRASVIVAVSHDTANRLVERYPTLRDRDVAVVPLGVEHARFNPDENDDRTVLDSLGVPATYLAFVGTIEPRKNIPQLVAAFDRVAESNADVHLVLAGQRGWGLEPFDAAVSAARHADRIMVTGYFPEHAVPALLRQARAVAYPSLAEGFGLPVLEALACGAPVVTTAGSVMEQMVGDAAVLVEPGNTDALVQALESMMDESSNPRRQIGLDVAARYTWEATAAAHVEVYKRAYAV